MKECGKSFVEQILTIERYRTYITNEYISIYLQT
jgi:hypothetical protein